MDKWVYQSFKCPNCGAVRLYNHRHLFDAQKDKKDFHGIVSGEYLTVQCPRCNKIFVDYGFVYKDRKRKKVMVFDTKESILTNFGMNEFPLDELYTITDIKDVYDCLFAIDHKLNWWVIKLYKLARIKDFLELSKEKGFKDLTLGRVYLYEEKRKTMLYIELKNENYCARDNLTKKMYKTFLKDWLEKAHVYIKKNYCLDEQYALDNIIDKED